jgi:hypothetical protein
MRSPIGQHRLYHPFIRRSEPIDHPSGEGGIRVTPSIPGTRIAI